MGWLITLGILVLLAILPLGVSAAYDSGGPLVRIIAGPVRLQVFPTKKKNKRPKEKKPKAEAKPQAGPETKPADAASQPGPKSQKGGSVKDFLPLVQMILELLIDFRRKLRVDRLELNLVMAGDDPCDLATNYGRAWAALGNLWPRLEELFVIKKRDVQLQCDFEAAETVVTAQLDLTITLGRLLGLGVRYGIRALKEIMKLNKGKGGAAT